MGRTVRVFEPFSMEVVHVTGSTDLVPGDIRSIQDLSVGTTKQKDLHFPNCPLIQTLGKKKSGRVTDFVGAFMSPVVFDFPFYNLPLLNLLFQFLPIPLSLS